MAGVKCEHCGELMQGKVRNKEVIGCITCKKPFRVTKELMQAYENEREQTVLDYIKRYWIYAMGLTVALLLASVMLFGESSAPVAAPLTQQQRIDNTMQDINDSVANDAVEQYAIAKRQGDKSQICSQAGYVSATYLQAKNELEYNKWKDIQKSDCEKVGIKY